MWVVLLTAGALLLGVVLGAAVALYVVGSRMFRRF